MTRNIVLVRLMRHPDPSIPLSSAVAGAPDNDLRREPGHGDHEDHYVFTFPPHEDHPDEPLLEEPQDDAQGQDDALTSLLA